MAIQLQHRRGTAAQVDAFVGAEGEITVDTDTGRLRTHDGSTAGGVRHVIEDDLGTMSYQDADNVSITGGAISGITALAVEDGGTGASTAADARANLSAAGRVSPATPGNLVQQTADGDLEDAGIAVGDLVSQLPDDFYEETVLPLDGDFASGELRIARMGNVVTVSMSPITTIGDGDNQYPSNPTTTAGFLPSRIRPAYIMYIYSYATYSSIVASIGPGGAIGLSSPYGIRSAEGFSISYITNYGWPSG